MHFVVAKSALYLPIPVPRIKRPEISNSGVWRNFANNSIREPKIKPQPTKISPFLLPERSLYDLYQFLYVTKTLGKRPHHEAANTSANGDRACRERPENGKSSLTEACGGLLCSLFMLIHSQQCAILRYRKLVVMKHFSTLQQLRHRERVRDTSKQLLIDDGHFTLITFPSLSAIGNSKRVNSVATQNRAPVRMETVRQQTYFTRRSNANKLPTPSALRFLYTSRSHASRRRCGGLTTP